MRRISQLLPSGLVCNDGRPQARKVRVSLRMVRVGMSVDQETDRLVGDFPDLEHELSGFSTHGYGGDESPNRADAFVWGMSELFPGLVRQPKKRMKLDYSQMHRGLV